MRRCHSCCGALNTICLIHVSASFWGELTCGSLRSCRSNIVDATKRCTSSSGALVRCRWPSPGHHGLHYIL
ncbi:hypothetical protein HBI80_086690 [Parastagonospora nodorum]|nr:hypothetical protein HBH75_159800 [Parastagonospora nodorum]KAH4905698.1 hypothetical protein HBI80_086690 [Parastagonospora nodorum]